MMANVGQTHQSVPPYKPWIYIYTQKKTKQPPIIKFIINQGLATHVESSWSFTLQNLHDSIKGSCIVLSSTTHIISHTSFQGLNGCHSQNSFRNSTTGTSQHAFRNGQLALIILENWDNWACLSKGGCVDWPWIYGWYDPGMMIPRCWTLNRKNLAAGSPTGISIHKLKSIYKFI